MRQSSKPSITVWMLGRYSTVVYAWPVLSAVLAAVLDPRTYTRMVEYDGYASAAAVLKETIPRSSARNRQWVPSAARGWVVRLRNAAMNRSPGARAWGVT
jgi:hypothetical protein